MDSLKQWLIEVAVKKMGPSAIRGAILGLFGWLMAKEGMLSSFGVVLDQATHTITIHLDQLNMVLVAGLPAALAAVIKMLNHHADTAVKAILPQTPSQQ